MEEARINHDLDASVGDAAWRGRSDYFARVDHRHRELERQFDVDPLLVALIIDVVFVNLVVAFLLVMNIWGGW